MESLGIFIRFKLIQPSNKQYPKKTIESGNVIFIRLVQSQNAPSLIECIFVGTFISFNLLHLLKAYSPIDKI